jgi:hypothetical protein
MTFSFVASARAALAGSRPFSGSERAVVRAGQLSFSPACLNALA